MPSPAVIPRASAQALCSGRQLYQDDHTSIRIATLTRHRKGRHVINTSISLSLYSSSGITYPHFTEEQIEVLVKGPDFNSVGERQRQDSNPGLPHSRSKTAHSKTSNSFLLCSTDPREPMEPALQCHASFGQILFTWHQNSEI